MGAGKNLTPAVLPILLSALLLWAGEPWRAKSYTEWNPEEVRKILSNSPWVRPVSIARHMTGKRPSEVGPGVTTPIETWASWKVAVQWRSSLTVRQALVRQRQLEGRHDEAEAGRFLAENPTDYVVMVFAPGDLFKDMDAESIRASAHLELREKNQTIPATTARLVEAWPTAVVAFHFPRDANGKPVISGVVKKIRFSCVSKDGRIAAGFDLRKMVRDGKPDL